jgi:protein Tex
MPRFTDPANVFARFHENARCQTPQMSQQADADPMTETVALKIVQRIATELNVQPRQVAAAVQLLDEGSTVPFIARYRKEVTGNLDDTHLRNLEERLIYLRELEDRRATIIQSIDDQGKLDAPLRAALESADSKQVLEDLYLPYKPKRRTRAQIAREAGLEPLARALLADPKLDPQVEAASFVNAEKGVADVKAALDGARDILSEQFGETAEILGAVRDYLFKQGSVISTVIDGKQGEEGEKFRDYYDYSETIRTVPSHRALALFRARNAGVLTVKLGLGDELDAQVPHPGEALIARHVGIANQGRAADKWLSDVCRWCWRVKVQPHIENELLTQLREQAETEAIHVFARNLKDLLLAAPAGPKAVIGLDPGLRTGVKVAVVDRTGKLLATDVIYPHEPRRDWDGSIAKLARLCAQTKAELISIGNGTASRETDKLASELIARHPELKLQKIVVSEAGASIYSASELASKEFPELDVSLRGAVSIARRLQDPLAELVKIEPKAIGVGQYQHDVNQRELARSLDAVVEDCVNAVGVDANTASVALLARVSGLNATLARNIVDFRDANGPFASREQLKKVPRLGEKTFEQAAGFLRINNGVNPLDSSSVHPEAYPVVERILAKISKHAADVMGKREALVGLSPAEFVDDRFGLPTVRDILAELEKPGRDPRPEFKTATFREGVEKLSDLAPGMVLEGVVTNVAAFGAFVDIGVHQDGLVHVSAMSTKFIKDPHEVVKAGQVVKVKVLETDVKRQRIALTMRLDDEFGATSADATAGAGAQQPRAGQERRGGGGGGGSNRDVRGAGGGKREPEPGGAMAAAFAKLKK